MKNKRDSTKPKARSPSGPPARQGPHMQQDAVGAGGLVNIPALMDLREAFDATPSLQGVQMGSALGPVEFMRNGHQGGG